jgi:hypothetical protein
VDPKRSKCLNLGLRKWRRWSLISVINTVGRVNKVTKETCLAGPITRYITILPSNLKREVTAFGLNRFAIQHSSAPTNTPATNCSKYFTELSARRVAADSCILWFWDTRRSEGDQTKERGIGEAYNTYEGGQKHIGCWQETWGKQATSKT